MTLTRTAPRVRPLSATEAAYAIDAGTRWAWQLEDDLAALYSEQILASFALAVERLDRAAALSPAGGLAAAAPGWTVPDPDELGLSLRELQDRLYETGRTGVPQRGGALDAETAIRVEALRRTTAAGLELMNLSLDARNPLIEGVLAERGQNIGIAETTRRQIMASLNSSWERGDSIPRAAAALREAAPDVARVRSTMIARTELIGVVNGGAHALARISNEAAAEFGEPLLGKIWLTAEDEKVRDSHRDAGRDYGRGKAIDLDAPFLVGRSAMQFPGDPDGEAEDVINCRCALSYEDVGAPAPLAARDEDAPAIDETGREGELGEASSETLGDLMRRQSVERGEARGFVPLDRATANEIRIDLVADEWATDRLTGMFQSQKLADNGLIVQASASQEGHDVSILAFIKTPDEKIIGELQRSIDLDAGVAKHEAFFLDDDWTGKGIGKDLMRSSVAEYDAAGISRIEVQAAGTNGRYTWARFGFDFQNPRIGIAKMREHFIQQLTQGARDGGMELGSSRLVEHLREAFPQTMGRIEAAQHPWEFAGISLDEAGLTDAEFGMNAMLEGPSWQGQLDLAPGSEGRRVFDDYTSR